jgi:uncharacterized protein YecT (DUF1311 family)
MKRLPWLMLALSGCAIHHVTPYVPDVSNAPQTADAAQASANCYEASTAAEIAICASPQLTAANRAMLAAFQTSLRAQTIFGRDALLASQRAWLLALPDQCHLSDPPKPAPAEAPACLASALAARASELAAWPAPPATPGGAIAQYVTFRPSAGAAAQPDPAFCPGFAARANDTLRTTGTLDPAAMGFSELAGTHGPDTAAPVSVDLYDANAFGLFQRRARGVAVGGTQLITPTSLTALLEAQNTANQGGRFSAFASQTGDYGSIDVFRDGARTLALAADPWGFTTPAAPGEAAHAGIWDITSGKATPVCLFDTYTRPAEPGVFDTLPSFSPWRDLLNQVRDSANLKLGQATKRDQGQLTADAAFTVLYMPLVARQQAAPWTLWLRRRHDDVLDALFTWSTQSAENKAVFDKLFALMRPAAADLVRAYQTTQALDAKEATQAGGTAVMELLYQATVNIAPGLGAAPDVASGYKPRYPILASPQ